METLTAMEISKEEIIRAANKAKAELKTKRLSEKILMSNGIDLLVNKLIALLDKKEMMEKNNLENNRERVPGGIIIKRGDLDYEFIENKVRSDELSLLKSFKTLIRYE